MIFGIVTRDHRQHQAAVIRGAAHRTQLVHAPRNGHRAKTADAPKTRAHAGNPAPGRRANDRSPRVRTQRPWRKPGGHHCARTTGRTASPIFVFHGFFAAPVSDALPAEYPSPPASSIIAALPINTAPASLKRSMIVALKSNCCFAYGRAPHVVGYPFTATRSFTAYGTP